MRRQTYGDLTQESGMASARGLSVQIEFGQREGQGGGVAGAASSIPATTFSFSSL